MRGVCALESSSWLLLSLTFVMSVALIGINFSCKHLLLYLFSCVYLFLAGDLTGAGADIVRGRFVFNLVLALSQVDFGWRTD